MTGSRDKLGGHVTSLSNTFMFTQFAHDLCAARKKAGLTPRDLSLLLEIDSSVVTALEQGATLPSIEQLCRLSIIYGRSFTELYQELMHGAREALFRKIPDLPDSADNDIARFNRDNTLRRLDRELTAALTQKHARP